MATKNNTEKYIKIAILLVVLGVFSYMVYLPFKKKKKDDDADEEFLKSQAENSKNGTFEEVGKAFKISEQDAKYCNDIAFKLHKSLDVTQLAGITINWNWFDNDEETIKQLNRVRGVSSLTCVNYYFKIHRKDKTANVAKEVKKHLGGKINEKNFIPQMISWLNIVENQAS
jgi:hypothetical protein